MKRKLYTIGEETKCISEWARQYNLPQKRVQTRLRQGMSIEEALCKSKVYRKIKISKEALTLQGKTLTITGWARLYKIPASRLYRRITKGMTLFDAIFEPRNLRKLRLKIDNQLLTIEDLSKIAHVTPTTIRSRIKRKWKKTELACQNTWCGPLTAFGRTQSKSEWARELGINPSTISRRLKTGWSLEKALSTPPNTTRHKHITINGETHTVGEWAKIKNIKKMTILDRISNGWPDEDAVLLPKNPKRTIKKLKTHA